MAWDGPRRHNKKKTKKLFLRRKGRKAKKLHSFSSFLTFSDYETEYTTSEDISWNELFGCYYERRGIVPKVMAMTD